MKCLKCDKEATFRGYILYKIGFSTPLMKFETPLACCEDHADQTTAALLLTKENIETLECTLKEQGYKFFDKGNILFGFGEINNLVVN